MRLTTLTTVTLGILTSLVAACVAQGGSRKTGRDQDKRDGDGDVTCKKVEKDVTIRSTADMSALPRTGCYDIYGKLVLQGQGITSLAALDDINSVNELELDHTALTAIDTKHPLGIYGKLTVTGNAKLTNLKQLSFQTASTGILIDGNTALTSLDPLGLADPKLEEVGGDIAITGNPALTQIPLGNLVRLTGGLIVSGNAQLTSLDLGKLASSGHIEIASNAKLASLGGFAASTINGDLAIHDNAQLTSLGTMSSLFRVTGNVTITGNPVLTNLAAFTTSLQYIDLSLTITNNAALTDLGALKHLYLVGAITITNNQNLVVCRAVEVDRCTRHPTTAVINNNKDANCNWQCN